MTKPLCRLCPNPAYFDFRDGVLLCAECAAEIFKLCEISDLTGARQREAATGAAMPSSNASVAVNISPPSPAATPDDVNAPITLHSSGVVGAEQSATREPQRSTDHQSQDEAKRRAPVNAGVVVAHEGIPEFLRRTVA